MKGKQNLGYYGAWPFNLVIAGAICYFSCWLDSKLTSRESAK